MARAVTQEGEGTGLGFNPIWCPFIPTRVSDLFPPWVGSKPIRGPSVRPRAFVPVDQQDTSD
jgi:hypothetical protein